METKAVETTANLEQNRPNPFNGLTTIASYVPETAQIATLQITNMLGKVVKVFELQAGQNEVTFDLTSTGTQNQVAQSYFYSLVVDGQIIDTKQMVLVK